MSIKTIIHDNTRYPAFQAEGNAMQFAIPFARKVCNGYGCDVGCNRKEWAYVDGNGVPALPVDLAFPDEYNALNLPPGSFDYIISSHMLEHVENWVSVLSYWQERLKKGGALFLYLPHYSQSYWRPWSNTKHVHILEPHVLREYLRYTGWENIFVSEQDLNNSFMVMANKSE